MVRTAPIVAVLALLATVFVSFSWADEPPATVPAATDGSGGSYVDITSLMFAEAPAAPTLARRMEPPAASWE
jgi:hypothetical protein